MAMTKLSDLVNPEVLSDMIGGNLTALIKFAPLAEVDNTLVGQAGDTITIPRYAYIGDAEDLTEGVAMGTVTLATSTQQVTIKEAGKAVEISKKAILSGYGDPVGEAARQLELSIASKVDNDLVGALGTATLTYDGSAAQVSYEGVINAAAKFGEEEDEKKVLFIHPNQKAAIQLDAKFVDKVQDAVTKAAIGEFGGCEVVVSKRVPFDNVAGTYSNFIVKEGALAIYLKEDTEIETDKDILARSVVVAATKYYVAALKDESKAVKATFKA